MIMQKWYLHLITLVINYNLFNLIKSIPYMKKFKERVFMMNTTAREVFESFESSFQDKVMLPEELEVLWLKKAIARYSVELDTLNFDVIKLEFDCQLDQYVIDTLATFMLQMYDEREWSKVNKQISIVGKDISIDGSGHTKTAAKAKAEYSNTESAKMVANQKPTAYS